MFTGIIAVQGTIKAITKKKNLLLMAVDLGALARQVDLGDSVALSGVCLTAVSKRGTVVGFELMRETLQTTTLGLMTVGDSVNLELALTPQTRLGGHFVTGHVDTLGEIKKIVNKDNWVAITISVPRAHCRYIVPKGSITIDGISLTVGHVKGNAFEVYLIPLTLSRTTLKNKRAGDRVNIETDILAKYISKKR